MSTRTVTHRDHSGDLDRRLSRSAPKGSAVNAEDRVHERRTSSDSTANVATGRVTCPRCRSRLEIFETPSGGRTVSVTGIGATIEAKALERFMAPGEGPDIICPACNLPLDPAAPYRGELRRFGG
jgi:DNA-directed RNA polymerase subunit RPC12/RpoP